MDWLPYNIIIVLLKWAGYIITMSFNLIVLNHNCMHYTRNHQRHWIRGWIFKPLLKYWINLDMTHNHWPKLSSSIFIMLVTDQKNDLYIFSLTFFIENLNIVYSFILWGGSQIMSAGKGGGGFEKCWQWLIYFTIFSTWGKNGWIYKKS